MRNLKQKIILLFIIFCIFLSPFPFAKAEETDVCNYKLIADSFSRQNSYNYLEELTSDKFEGRQSGTKGAYLAAQWISGLFEGFGLMPGGDKGSYFQDFDVPYYDVIPPLSFSISNSTFKETLQYKKDFIVLPGSGSGKINSKIVFAGYGITSEAKSYDDYKNLDVAGKIVLIMRKSPSTINLGEESAYFQTKVKNAVEHGAIGIIVAEKATERYKMVLNTKYVGGITGSIPALFITTEVADKILSDEKVSLLEIEKRIDMDKKPFSFETKCSCDIYVNVISEQRKTSNVIGYIPARNKKSKESILITAHYDHLGTDKIDGSIYRGANDNASGTAVLLEVARTLSANNCYLPSINVVFIAFSGEEEGLIGSYNYVNNPLFPLSEIRAVLNMDMVGTGNGILIAGTDQVKYKELTDNIKQSSDCLDINVPIVKNLLNAGSDHYFFHINNVPNVFFIRDNPTGIGGYHNTFDTPDTVDPTNLSETGELVILITSIFSSPYYVSFDNYYWQGKISVHKRVFISGTKKKNLKLLINEEEISPNFKKFYKIVSLKNGDNIINIKIFLESELIFEKIINIKADVDEGLICDFNFDFKVDLTDLINFSKHYGEEVQEFNQTQIFDIDGNKLINEADLSKFDSCFGYIHGAF